MNGSRQRGLRVRGASVVLIATVLALSARGAVHTKVVDTGTLVPGTAQNFEDLVLFDGPAISAGSVAFRGQSTNPDLSPREGIYTTLGGSLIAVAETDDAIPDGGGDVFASDNNVFGFGPPSISGSNIVFQGDSAGATDRGIYAKFGPLPLETIADTRTGSNGGFTTMASPAIDGDNIAYWGFSVFTFPLVTSFEGIYKHSGGSGGSSATVADKDDTVLGITPVRTMQSFSSAQVEIAGDDTVFMALDSFGQRGLYRTFGNLAVGKPRVYSDTVIPDHPTEVFDLFFTSSVSADGTALAFEGQNDDGAVRGIYTVGGFNVMTAVDLNTDVPGEPASSRGSTTCRSKARPATSSSWAKTRAAIPVSTLCDPARSDCSSRKAIRSTARSSTSSSSPMTGLTARPPSTRPPSGTARRRSSRSISRPASSRSRRR
ncbi:MAG: hypothetical protein CMJ18_05435 [Phycisphaeraceae bacterium]|nr:hypothetical protein [Phycisphaeraceae bacterium]